MSKANLEKLNIDLILLINKRNELARLDYNSQNYDDVEEELHDMEDDFLDEYGEYLESVLQAIHDEFCPESDVLLPIAYLAKKYYVKEKNGKNLYSPYPGEGVFVEVDNYINHDTRIVFVPDPIRLVLIIDKSQIEELWRAE